MECPRIFLGILQCSTADWVVHSQQLETFLPPGITTTPLPQHAHVRDEILLSVPPLPSSDSHIVAVCQYTDPVA
jgi:hypothetical protein